MNTWGISWGASWGNSWGAGNPPPPVAQGFQPGSKGQDFHDERVQRLRLEEELILLFLS